MNTLETVKAIALEVIEEEPLGRDFVYQPHVVADGGPRCRYAVSTDGGPAKPDCIVGRVLAKLGVDPEIMVFTKSGDNTFSTGGAVYMIDDLVRTRKVDEFEEDALSFLSSLQYKQDDEATWGDAYDVASDF